MPNIHFANMSKTVGQRIRQARSAAGMTQDELASRSGVTRSAVSQWETGAISSIEAGTLLRAAKALSVSLDWLLSGADHAVEEHAEEYQSVPTELLRGWSRLTASQRSAVLAEISRLADLADEIRKETR